VFEIGPGRAQDRARAGLVFRLSPQSRPRARPPGQACKSPSGPGFWAKPSVQTPSPPTRPGPQKPALYRPDPALVWNCWVEFEATVQVVMEQFFLTLSFKTWNSWFCFSGQS
jgi:hypothetical protein